MRETILDFQAGTKLVDGVARPIRHIIERVVVGPHYHWVVSAFLCDGEPQWAREFRSRGEAVAYWRGLCTETKALTFEGIKA